MAKNKIKSRLHVVMIAAFVALAVFVSSALSGCSFLFSMFDDEEISFTRSSLTLHVGETVGIAQYVDSDTASYTLSSDNPAVVSVNVSKREITAEAVGVAYITAETSTSYARLKVTVEEPEQDALSIEAEGELIQTFGETTAVTFKPTTSGAASKGQIAWYVNGRFINLLPQRSSFTYTPSEVGIFVITAKVGTFSDEATVRVYYSSAASVEYSGELVQNGAPFADITFTVVLSEEIDCYIQWFEDGRQLYAGEELVFVYTPHPGRYTLSAKVNGKEVYSVEVSFKGPVVPDAPTLEFDNLYPHAYLVYEAAGKVKVEISFPDGQVREYAEGGGYASLFGRGRMDVGSVISLCATDSARRTYRFRVKSMGDGDVYTESAYSEYYDFTQLPQAAAKYISTILPGGDLYVTSDSEYVAVAEYYVFARKKTAGTRVSFDCYIAYDREGSAADLWNDVFVLAATSGLYTNITASDSGSVMTTSFTVSTVNAPTRQTYGTAGSGEYASQLHAILPHINYDQAKYRPSDYVFPIDRREHSISVTYSDELYYAAEGGYTRPEPVAGSAAETIYNLAKGVLRKICTDEMTDVQKAHAIYDWIMWQVTYDNPAADTKSNSEALSAYYLEGVFGDGDTLINGFKYSPVAVCDGISKAYAMMCNIEGIPCVRVIGKAGKSLREAGGHAWNKVYLGGQWYSVDCTWGDTQAQISLDGRSTVYELGLHDHLFLTDAQMSSTHYEPYQSGESGLRYAPVTAKEPINVFETMTFNGRVINCSISAGENQQTRIREIASAYADAYTKINSITVPGGPNGGAYGVTWQGFEIYCESGVTISDGTMLSTISSAIRAVHRNATVLAFTIDKFILVLVK